MKACVCNEHWNQWVPMIERRIIGAAVRIILDQGLMITVWDGEEVALSASVNPDDILGVIGDTDITIFNVQKVDGYMHGFIVFIHGNNEDVLSDHSIGIVLENIVDKIAKEVQST